MKIALFVLSCLIAVSRQQNALWSMPQYHSKVPLQQYHYPVANNLRQWSNIFSGSYHPYYSYSQPQYVKYFPAQNNPAVVLFKSFQQQQQPVSSFVKFFKLKNKTFKYNNQFKF
jgi:hypothetical protein